jgi:hypothetical protein
MLSGDRTDFDALMKELCHGLGCLPHPERLDGYWKGLAKMSLIQFGRLQEFLLSADSPVSKLPPVPELWKIWRQFQSKSRAQVQTPNPIAPPDSKWLKKVNGQFVRYMRWRRQTYKGDILIVERREKCRELATYLEMMAADRMPVSDGEVARMFFAHMSQIVDGGTTGAEAAAEGVLQAPFQRSLEAPLAEREPGSDDDMGEPESDDE